MLVCPACAEDLGDDATRCDTCGTSLPGWLTRPVLSTPPARPSLFGWAFVIVCGALLFFEVSGAMGWLAYLDTLHRR
jgi:hypothetical protein